MKIWVDFMAPCDIFFFSSIIRSIPIDELSYFFSGRNHVETKDLLSMYSIEAQMIGKHSTDSSFKQISSFVERILLLYSRVPDFDFSFSLANIYGVTVSLLRRRPSISVIDNDLIEYRRSVMESLAAKVHAKASWIIAPRSYPVDLTVKNGADPSRILTFDGYKEDIYVSSYTPDVLFPQKVPFDEYVVVRPEALYSTYVHMKNSLTPLLLKRFIESGVNVIYLPRSPRDLAYVEGIKERSRIWVPPHPLNGLDLAYYSKAVLTGSGTFAREAACMNKVAVSYFPDKLLAVDASLCETGRMFHSLDANEIVDYVLYFYGKNIRASFENSIRVNKEFISILSSLFKEFQ